MKYNRNEKKCCNVDISRFTSVEIFLDKNNQIQQKKVNSNLFNIIFSQIASYPVLSSIIYQSKMEDETLDGINFCYYHEFSDIMH